MSHVVLWSLKFKSKDALISFLSWFNILSKALRNEVISDDDLVQFFKLDSRADLIKKRASFEGIIKNYVLLGFEPKKHKISEGEYLFVMKYNFLFSVSAFIKWTLRNTVFKRIKRDVEFRPVKKVHLVDLFIKK